MYSSFQTWYNEGTDKKGTTKMFYKVTIIEKNDNHREMIVKADSREAAVEMIPAVKAFLFPGEDTSESFAL